MPIAKRLLAKAAALSQLVSIEAESLFRMFERRNYREQEVERILTCFKDMGANPENLEGERRRLLEDDLYLESWQEATSA